MPKAKELSSTIMINQAEQELAAFLCAATKFVGAGDLLRAGEIWINTMKSLDWTCEHPEKFFRRVTVQAAAQLLARAA
jgi:hypothetical protein